MFLHERHLRRVLGWFGVVWGGSENLQRRCTTDDDDRTIVVILFTVEVGAGARAGRSPRWYTSRVCIAKRYTSKYISVESISFA